MSGSEVDRVTEAAIEDKIFDLFATRKEAATICPSEVARALIPGDDRWRELMPQIRQVAEGLARNDRLKVTRGGVPVDATCRGGPIRLGRPTQQGDPRCLPLDCRVTHAATAKAGGLAAAKMATSTWERRLSESNSSIKDAIH